MICCRSSSSGVTAGSLYGLAGLGLVLTYKTSGRLQLRPRRAGRRRAPIAFFDPARRAGRALAAGALLCAVARRRRGRRPRPRTARPGPGRPPGRPLPSWPPSACCSSSRGWSSGATDRPPSSFPVPAPAPPFRIGGVAVSGQQVIIVAGRRGRRRRAVRLPPRSPARDRHAGRGRRPRPARPDRDQPRPGPARRLGHRLLASPPSPASSSPPSWASTPPCSPSSSSRPSGPWPSAGSPACRYLRRRPRIGSLAPCPDQVTWPARPALAGLPPSLPFLVLVRAPCSGRPGPRLAARSAPALAARQRARRPCRPAPVRRSRRWPAGRRHWSPPRPGRRQAARLHQRRSALVIIFAVAGACWCGPRARSRCATPPSRAVGATTFGHLA